MKSRVELTRLTLTSPRLLSEERLLILADLHQQTRREYADEWLAVDPTAILIPGDWVEGRERTRGRAQTLSLLRQLSEQCPVFYSLGNHELGLRGNRLPLGECTERSAISDDVAGLPAELTDCGVQLLCNRYVRFHSLCIGGLTPAGGGMLDAAWQQDMMHEDGFRLLLCHHPEYYEPYVRRYSLDLTVAGHAHGGQWRFFGQGIYAPGQGLFPRYTSGFYNEQRLLVSRGLAGRFPFPRLFNKRQAILLTLLPETQ
ncbi:MAG: metallophosphoesterase [Clostridia bacterium]|nr:metallophosphoesterase [Clostridia bacterium]